MYMGMMGFIVKGCIPFQISAVDFIILCQKLHPTAEQCLPLCCIVIPKPFRIFSSQADDIRPDNSGMVCHLLCHLGKHYRLPFIRKQTVSTYFFYSRSVRQIINIVFLFRYDVQIVFQCLRDKLRGILSGWSLEIVVILMHAVCIGNL